MDGGALKYRFSFLLFLIAFLLQSTVVNHFSVLHVAPNLILCLVVIFSFLYEGTHGIIFGILFGFITDICFAEIIGVASMSYFIVALLCLEMKRYLYKDSFISILIVTALGTVIYTLTYWGITELLGNSVEFLTAAKMGAVLLVYHGLITWLMYLIISRRIIKHHSDRYMYRGSLQEARSLNKE